MSFQAVAWLDELGAEPVPVNVQHPVTGDVQVAVVRIGEEVFAIMDECSHAMVRLSEGDVDAASCSIECYQHGSRFDLRTGAAINLPATEPVPVFPCLVEDGQILVDVEHPINTQE